MPNNNVLTDEQVEAAKAAGFYWHPIHKGLVARHSNGSWVSVDAMLARFVALLASHPTNQPDTVRLDDHEWLNRKCVKCGELAGQSEPRDAIARSKRILCLVDAYHENPTRDTRTALRVALMDEFQPEPRGEVAAWQPIETAPKDGTPLLLFARAKHATASVPVIGWWLPDLGWIESVYSPNHPVGIVPSHWMPRPKFPDAARAGESR